MKERRDPLGIDKLVGSVREKHAARPITGDEFSEWLSHPVTQRLHEELALELQTAMPEGDFEKGRVFQAEQTLNWQPGSFDNAE